MSFYSHICLFLCKFKNCYSFIKGAPSSYKYFKLTPYDDVDCDYEPYRQLKFALFSNNEDIRNIAVSGDYGSGKSSLINSFIKKERIDKSSICISLATFDLSENIKKSDNSLVVEKKGSVQINVGTKILYSI
ncbi:hypothetical protein [Succinivibrio dextrinosolvens]|uniref:YobI family P-loop NTPase n=1 Tax=Succinivibrio dextrinosolvens TaxID=83771 RepID=UPI0004E1AD97|nr:hypothetical protein [Succinivibrio dextrinosolvens]